MTAENNSYEEKIKELQTTIEALEKDLIHDSLTGLKTRAFFEEEARVYFSVAMSTHANLRKEWFGFRRVSFIFLDIDDFKKINDTYGHLAGDEVLKSVAEVIKHSVRDGDTVARWGGEEMAITLIGATETDACRKAEEIRKKVEALKFPNNPDLKVTISAGVATAVVGKSFDETLDCADKALYKAKETGKNKVVSYSSLSV